MSQDKDIRKRLSKELEDLEKSAPLTLTPADLPGLSAGNSQKVNDIIDSVYGDLFGGMPGGNKPSMEEYRLQIKQQLDLLSAEEKAILDGKKPSAPAPQNAGAQSPAGAQASTGAQENATAQEKAVVEEPETDPMDDLNALVGLTDVKKDVGELINLVRAQQLRKEQGLKAVPVSKHLVFSGNPGTGKTTVARILGRLYKQIGALSKGQLVEVDRSGLVAGYVGQTAIKTQEKIHEAMGGVLFIDEAYALNKEGNDYGQEAIDTILKAMEDNRDDFVVIVAGYTELMEEFINSNPGLKSRFNKYILFPDYTAEELIAIFDSMCSRYSYTLTPDARAKLEELIRYREQHKDENFANARDMRNLFEIIITNQASRIASIKDPGKDVLTTIETADLEELDHYA